MAASMDTLDAATEDPSRAMSNLDITKSPPVLDDLMKWHLYIGYSREDSQPVKELHELLQSKKLTFSYRSGLDVEEQSQADNIKQGMFFSHKCLLFISPDYLKDPNSQLELKEAERKWKLLGKNSVLGIVKYNVKKEQLGAYEKFQLIYLKDGQKVQDCLVNSPNWDVILNDYKLEPGLSLVQKENIGVGVAYTYFFSFLQMVVPGVRKQIIKEIRHSAAAKEPTNKKFLVKKMLIIIPKTLVSPLKLADDTNIKRTDRSIKQCFHRAGKERREYTLPIYELTDQKSGKVYYFVTDIPSCLYAIREAHDCDPTIMSGDDVYETRNDFVLTLKALLNHPRNSSNFENQWELLLWPEIDDEKNPVTLSEFVSQKINSKGLAEKLKEALDSEPESSDCEKPKDERRGYAGGISAYPMYSERPRYDLKHPIRGYCVIISNKYFVHHQKRECADIEINNLENLFKALKFEVVVKRDLGGQQMLSILKESRDKICDEFEKKDHSKSDAFVCCLLSHGSRGRVFGIDEDSISVVELMELFYDDKCPGLKGKPKLFFIGTCQSRPGGSVAKDKEPDTSLQLTSAKPGLGHRSESLDTKTDAVPEEHSENVVRDLVPSNVDFIVSYACLPNTQALRDEVKGGYYVQALCKHLTQDLEIDVALRHVNQEVRELFDEYEKDGGKEFSRPDPFHIIMPPQKFLFLNSISENRPINTANKNTNI